MCLATKQKQKTYIHLADRLSQYLHKPTGSVPLQNERVCMSIGSDNLEKLSLHFLRTMLTLALSVCLSVNTKKCFAIFTIVIETDILI